MTTVIDPITIAFIGFAGVILATAVIYRAKNRESVVQYNIRERQGTIKLLEEVIFTAAKIHEEIHTLNTKVHATIKYATAEEMSQDGGEMESIAPHAAVSRISTYCDNLMDPVMAKVTLLGSNSVINRVKNFRQSVYDYIRILRNPTFQPENIDNIAQEIEIKYDMLVSSISIEKLVFDNNVARASLPWFERLRQSKTIGGKIIKNQHHIHELRQRLNRIKVNQEELLEEELQNIVSS